MNNSGYKYLFGPVPSRRLGISLGVDLIPHKVCTLNCVYCECGRTSKLTTVRGEFIPTKDIIAEISRFLENKPKLDYITFSGYGEPMLHSGIGEIVTYLGKEHPEYKTALITNSTMFSVPGVIEEILPVDVIMPSLDAATQEMFIKINRPAESLTANQMIDGLVSLRQKYTGEIWLEIFIIQGLNDTDNEIEQLKKAVHQIKPDRVQLNTLDRPGTEEWVSLPAQGTLERIASRLDYQNTEIIAKFYNRDERHKFSGDIEAAIVELIKRRPCTIDDLSSSLGLNTIEINKYLAVLLTDGAIKSERMDRGIFFKYMEINSD